MVQGDTTTAMCGASAAFYRKIKIAHVEAGLRTHDIYSPFPEEFNRVVISKIANLHFASTGLAKQNLLDEKVDDNIIYVTGNTVIDALFYTRARIGNKPTEIRLSNWIFNANRKMILITGHRRENFGSGFENICEAIRKLSQKYIQVDFVYPVHLNPNVQEPVNRLLSGLPNVFLCPPVDYVTFTGLMECATIILTDSGGVQEEAPSLGKPVLVMRNTTERPEAVSAGAARLVGVDKDNIFENVCELIEDHQIYTAMSQVSNPFGDGHASERIVSHIQNYFR